MNTKTLYDLREHIDGIKMGFHAQIMEMFDWLGVESRDKVADVLANKVREVDGYEKQDRVSH